MWEEVKLQIQNLFAVHRERKLGFMLGIFLGAVILTIGPLKTFFIFFCGVIGLYIGSRFDGGDDLIGKTLRAIEKALPKRFQRW